MDESMHNILKCKLSVFPDWFQDIIKTHQEIKLEIKGDIVIGQIHGQELSDWCEKIEIGDVTEHDSSSVGVMGFIKKPITGNKCPYHRILAIWYRTGVSAYLPANLAKCRNCPIAEK